MSAQASDKSSRLNKAFADHPRSWRENLYVYPVISRRSGGLSIGINLNPDKACNFGCVYCQVDRREAPRQEHVHVEALAAELDGMLTLVKAGTLWQQAFAQVPAEFRRLADLAFSGDAEPTNSPAFPEAVRVATDAKRRHELTGVKIRVLTNACYLTRPNVKRALAVLDDNEGEIWAKLDAGTEEYYRQVNRGNVPLQHVLDNILDAARIRPIVIQSLWVCLHGKEPPERQVRAFAQRLSGIIEAGGAIKLVQIYTTARNPAEAFVTAVPDRLLDRIARIVRQQTGLCVESYYGLAE